MALWNQNARIVLQARYLKRDSEGKLLETEDGLLARVAEAVAKAEPALEQQKMAERFYKLLDSLVFLPNSPTLMNAGRELGQLSGCLAGDSIVRCCSGDATIKELEEKYRDKPDERFEVYSVSGFNELTIGKAFFPRMTQKNANVFKVTFDDGSSIKATADHLMMHRNGKYSTVADLQVGYSVMPFNYDYNNGYLIVS